MGVTEGANYAAVMTALAERAAEELNGTCRTLHELGAEYERAKESVTFCARLDELSLCCSVCNWWDEPSEMAE